MSTTLKAKRTALGEVQCPKCDHAPFATHKGLAMHDFQAHQRKVLAPPEMVLAPPERNGHGYTCDECAKSFKKAHGLHIHEAVIHHLRRAKSARVMVDRIIDSFASKNGNGKVARLGCPACQFDLEPLTGGAKPATYCPGCGTPLQGMVDRLAALTKKHI